MLANPLGILMDSYVTRICKAFELSAWVRQYKSKLFFIDVYAISKSVKNSVTNSPDRPALNGNAAGSSGMDRTAFEGADFDFDSAMHR
jgi:hypothetical protein